MAQHNRLGKEGERLSVGFLRKKGYTILEANWRFVRHEIDIIARHQDTLVFIEVKTRASSYFGEPEIFVSKAQQKRIINAANEYIMQKKLNCESRFDVVAIVKENNVVDIHHIEDAFYPLA